MSSKDNGLESYEIKSLQTVRAEMIENLDKTITVDGKKTTLREQQEKIAEIEASGFKGTDKKDIESYFAATMRQISTGTLTQEEAEKKLELLGKQRTLQGKTLEEKEALASAVMFSANLSVDEMTKQIKKTAENNKNMTFSEEVSTGDLMIVDKLQDVVNKLS